MQSLLILFYVHYNTSQYMHDSSVIEVLAAFSS